MAKKILVIQANPIKNSFGHTLAETYIKAAKNAGAEIKILELADLQFDLNLSQGFKSEKPLEPGLINAQEWIKWAEHLVFVYPTWWATFPALLKGFIDRTFLPGFAFKYRPKSVLWDKLLRGRSARLIVTMDSPTLYYRFFVGQPGHKAMKKGILQFCGVSPVKISSFGSVKTSTETKRKKWLIKVEKLGGKMI